MKLNQSLEGILYPLQIKNFSFFLATLAILFIINVSKGYAQSKQALGSLAAGQPVANSTLISEIPPEGLQVGDPIPENVWNLPLQVVNHPEGKETITLGDFKGKLIILDFWATWCGSCIEYMPKMSSLQEDFGEEVRILPIAYQPADKILPFWKNNFILKSLPLLSVVEDTLLKSLFTHRMIPHLVWIDPQGKYLGATSSYDARRETIGKVVQNQQVTFISPKQDQLTYDEDKPLFLDGNGEKEEHYLYRSFIAPYIGGIPSQMGSRENAGTVRLYATNQSIVNMYKWALRESSWPENRILFEGVNRDSFIIQNWYEERDEKVFCYELLISADRKAESYQIMLDDLNRFFQLDGRIEKRKVACYVLKLISPEKLSVSKGDVQENNYRLTKPGEKKYQRNQPIFRLVGYLNRLSDTLIVLDETNFSDPVDLVLNSDLSDFSLLNEALSKYGLRLFREERMLDLLVISRKER